MMRVLAILAMLWACAVGAMADPARWTAEGWATTDFSKSKVSWSEILSGGPPRDGIPPIDDPQFRPVAESGNLADREPVIGLEINGDARAYPLQVLIWHEIVNDTVGGRPVTVTYCPLCNAAIVFDRRVAGKTLDFGTSGLLRNSDLIMYDRQTMSWWQQFTGEAIVGEMLGQSLAILPARLESFADFRTVHPNGKVLHPKNPAARPYGRNPYTSYDSAARPFLYSGELPQGIDPMARVVVVRRSGAPLIVAMDKVRLAKTWRDGAIELTWKEGQASAVDTEIIAEGRDVGTIRAFAVAADGTHTPLAYDVTFAFVAHAFHPNVPIIK